MDRDLLPPLILVAMRCTRTINAGLRFAVLGAAFLCVLAVTAAAETGAEAWLRYSALSPQAARTYERLPGKVVMLDDSVVLKSAQQELVRGAAQMLGETLRVAEKSSPES